MDGEKVKRWNLVDTHLKAIKSNSSIKTPEKTELVYELKNLWILKPVGMNRGQGIHVVDSLKKCKKLIREYFFGREYCVNGGLPT